MAEKQSSNSSTEDEYSESESFESSSEASEESSNSSEIDSPKTPKSPNLLSTKQMELEAVQESNRLLSTGILELQNTLKLKNERIKALESEIEGLRIKFIEQNLAKSDEQRELQIKNRQSFRSQLCLYTFVGVLCFAVGLVFSYPSST